MVVVVVVGGGGLVSSPFFIHQPKHFRIAFFCQSLDFAWDLRWRPRLWSIDRFYETLFLKQMPLTTWPLKLLGPLIPLRTPIYLGDSKWLQFQPQLIMMLVSTPSRCISQKPWHAAGSWAGSWMRFAGGELHYKFAAKFSGWLWWSRGCPWVRVYLTFRVAHLNLFIIDLQGFNGGGLSTAWLTPNWVAKKDRKTKAGSGFCILRRQT